jgi:hydrogenase expression/formation protein HypE
VTTDGFTVKPLEFPGGNIGSLAVHGTVNDLAVVGAIPRFMTLSVFIEEGLDIAVLRRVADALAQAASACGVSVVAGDTKVVGRGECDGIYLSTTGIGFKSSNPGERDGWRSWRRSDARSPGIWLSRRP